MDSLQRGSSFTEIAGFLRRNENDVREKAKELKLTGESPKAPTKRDLLVLSFCRRNNRAGSRFCIIYFQCEVAIPGGNFHKLCFQFRILNGIRALVVRNSEPKVSRFVRKWHHATPRE
jgi:hypothetical protein